MPDEEKLLEEVVTMRVKGETAGLKEKEELLESIKGMHESNPMMGSARRSFEHRRCLRSWKCKSAPSLKPPPIAPCAELL
jgi:hypothetical protein